MLSKKDTLSEITYAGMKINQTANKKFRQNYRVDKWHKKVLYGCFPKIVEQNDTENLWSWLRKTSIKGETEGLLTAAQDQCLNTRNYRNKILGQNIHSVYRVCKQANETVSHI